MLDPESPPHNVANIANQAQAKDPVVAKKVTIEDFELQIQPRRKHLFARRYRVKVCIGRAALLTKIQRERNNKISWDHKMDFDVQDHSALLVHVYRRHRIFKEKLIGSLTDTISGVLGKLRDGVLEQPLSKGSFNMPTPSKMTVRFKVQHPLGFASNERQATDALATASEAIDKLLPTPASVNELGSMVDTNAKIAAKIETFDNTWGVLLDRMELFTKIVGSVAQIHPFASLAWSVISAANQILVNQKNRDAQIVRLAGTMSDVFDFVHDAEPLKAVKKHMKTITILVQQVTECGYFITEYAKQKNFWIRMAKYTISDIDGRITKYQKKFQELKSSLLEGMAVRTGVTVFRMMNVVENVAQSIDLNDMLYAIGAMHSREDGCLPGTRESFLREICDVLNNPNDDAPQVCLLTGIAGSGKSAVANSIAGLYEGQQRLGSSYCFSRAEVTSRNPQNLFSTIARDLADNNPEYKSALWEVVKDRRALRMSTSPLEQVERLIVEPLEQLHPVGPVIIVIDALDESGDQAGRKRLLQVISKQLSQNAFPPNLRFFITARPESDILSAFASASHLVHKRMEDVPDDEVDGDIHKFFHHSLHEYTELEETWPNHEWCRLLVSSSHHLFQWASIACNFIQGDGNAKTTPSQRLETLLRNEKSTSVHPLDGICRTILDHLFSSTETREAFRDVMAIVLLLEEPLSLRSLSALFEQDKDLDFRGVIKPMELLLAGATDEEKPIHPFHSSFRDFLLDEARSSAFYVPILPQHSLRLGRALLRCMRSKLRFNICDLKDARQLNVAIPDLSKRVKSAIPPHLVYSCQHWMVHLARVECTQDLQDEVISFFKGFFPYWLEAISLLSHSSPLVSILSALETCTKLKKWAKDAEVANLASEAFQFIQAFTPVLRKSTPHLYLSAMPQTPSESPLSKLWVDHLQKHGSINSAEPAHWPALMQNMHEHLDGVNSIAYSPDGAHIVSGSSDKTIRIWDATTGQLVAGPFEGHLDCITSVAYSPDGTHLISGSRDKTIRVYNAVTGQLALGPFEGHSDWVTCVVYSPDGLHITSGSVDNTIRVWDAGTGQHIGIPFEGHSDWVSCVAYSPDGTCIVSGSLDNTVRIWDSSSGQLTAGPFEGHSNWVNCVVYSPDGTYIASGSSDNTIRVWDANTGQLVAGPFQGHSKWVNSIAFAPDGTCVVSGSLDKTIRVWDISTGQLVAGPFIGHEDSITSVIYSPDGTHIVSGSADMTIKVWNPAGGQLVSNLFEGHSDWVNSIACSHDGVYLVSGSQDKTIRIWNTTTGHLVAGPFQGHTSSVKSVACSVSGNCVISASDDNTIRVWNITSGQLIAGPLKGHSDWVNSVACAPDGICFTSGSSDNTIRVWNATTGRLVAGPFRGHSDAVNSVAYSPNGAQIVSGSSDRTIRIWSTSGWLVAGPFKGHTDLISSVVYSPDGTHIISGSDDCTIGVWDIATGQLVGDLLSGHLGPVKSVTYSPDGIYLVSGSQDNTIRVWNAADGQLLAGPFMGHSNWISSVVYSPDGKHVISGSHDHSIKVWRVEEFAFFGDLHEKDGWIQSSNSACFGWMVTWNQHDRWLPVHSLIISPQRTLKDEVDHTVFGESWMSCWK